MVTAFTASVVRSEEQGHKVNGQSLGRSHLKVAVATACWGPSRKTEVNFLTYWLSSINLLKPLFTACTKLLLTVSSLSLLLAVISAWPLTRAEGAGEVNKALSTLIPLYKQNLRPCASRQLTAGEATFSQGCCLLVSRRGACQVRLIAFLQFH